MAFLSLVGKRMLAQRMLALALLITMAFAIGVLVAGPIYANGSQEAILSGKLAQSDVSLKNVRLSAYSAPGFSQLSADQAVTAALRGLPVTHIVRQAETYQLNFVGERSPIQTFVGYRDGAFRHLRIRGRAPVAPDEIAVPEGDGYPLGGVGARVRIQAAKGLSVDLTVTGVFVIPTGDQQFWFGSQSIFPQTNNPTSPSTIPILTTEPGFEHIAQSLHLATGQLYEWDAYLNLDGKSVDQIRAIPPMVQQAAVKLTAVPGLSTVTAQTGLDTIAELVDQLTGNAKVPIYLVVFQIGAVALAVVAGVASLALSNQSFELAVLKSRGFTRTQLLVAQGAGAALVAVMALPIGLVIGVLLARLGRVAHGPYIAGSSFPISLDGAAIVVGLVGALLGTALVVAVSIPHVSRTVVEERRETSREARPLFIRFPVELVVLPLGLFALWEARVHGLGSNAVTGSIDPLVLLAPTLLLFGVSFAALRLLSWSLRRFDGPIGHLRYLPSYLAGRRLARTAGVSFASALLLVLATGLLVISSSYRATILQSHADEAHQQVGGDWSVAVDTVPQSLAAMHRVPPATTPVYGGQTDLIDLPTAVSPATLGIDPGTYQQGAWWRSDYADQSLPALLQRLAVPMGGVPVGSGSNPPSVTMDAPADIAGYRLDVMTRLPNDSVVKAGSASIVPGRHTYSFTARGGARLLSIVIERPPQVLAPKRVTVRIVSATTGTGPVNVAEWQPLQWLSGDSRLTSVSDGLEVSIRPGSGQVIGGIVPPSPAIPVLASKEVAASAGRRFQGVIAGTQLTFRVVAVPKGFPGTDASQPFLVVPEAALYQALEAIPEPSDGMNQIWAMGSADPSVGIRRAGFTVETVTSARSLEGALSLDSQSLAVGMHFTAAVGGMVLVVIGVAVALYFGQRRRRFEFAALRALGTEPRSVITTLTLEQVVVIGYSLGAAFVIAWALLRLMMPYLGPSISNAFPAPVLVTDWTAMAVFGAAVVGAAAVGLALAVRGLLSASVTSVLRGEAE
jgi:hypothetical protein